jgi:hypothetical protein
MSGHLFPLALWTAFPSSLAGRDSCDYYGNSVAIGLASRRRSHVRPCRTCLARRRRPTHLLECPRWASLHAPKVASAMLQHRRRTWHRFQTSFRRMRSSISWRLGFTQSSIRHITRVPQRLAPYAWARPLVSWHALVPLTFRRQVSHQTQEPPFEFLPTPLGIQQGASWRTSIPRRTSGCRPPARAWRG